MNLSELPELVEYKKTMHEATKSISLNLVEQVIPTSIGAKTVISIDPQSLARNFGILIERINELQVLVTAHSIALNLAMAELDDPSLYELALKKIFEDKTLELKMRMADAKKPTIVAAKAIPPKLDLGG